MRRERASRLPQHISVHPADLRCTLRAPLGHACCELVEAIDPFLHELVVVQVLLDDHVAHGHGQRSIGARAKLEMVFRMRGYPGELRIDHDQLGAHLHEVDERMPEEPIRIRIHRVLPPDQDVLGKLPAGILVAIREVRCIVQLRVSRSQLEVRDGAARPIARAATEHHAVVGRSEDGMAVRRGIHGYLAARPREGEDALRPRHLPEMTHLGFDEVKGLVPADLLPRILAPVSAVALHGMQDAVRVIESLIHRYAPRAQPPLGDGMRRIALHVDDLVVLHGHDDAASNGMIPGR